MSVKKIMMCTFQHTKTFDKASFYVNKGWCFILRWDRWEDHIIEETVLVEPNRLINRLYTVLKMELSMALIPKGSEELVPLWSQLQSHSPHVTDDPPGQPWAWARTTSATETRVTWKHRIKRSERFVNARLTTWRVVLTGHVLFHHQMKNICFKLVLKCRTLNIKIKNVGPWSCMQPMNSDTSVRW